MHAVKIAGLRSTLSWDCINFALPLYTHVMPSSPYSFGTVFLQLSRLERTVVNIMSPPLGVISLSPAKGRILSGVFLPISDSLGGLALS